MLSKQQKRKQKRERQRRALIRRVRTKINKVIYDKVRIVQGCKNLETWTSLSQVAVPKPFRLGSLWYCKNDTWAWSEEYGKKIYRIIDVSEQAKEVFIEEGWNNDSIFLVCVNDPTGYSSMSINRFIENWIPYTGSAPLELWRIPYHCESCSAVGMQCEKCFRRSSTYTAL